MQFSNLNFYQSPTADPATLSSCDPPSPTCGIVEFHEMESNNTSINRIRMPIGSNAQSSGFETRVTLLAADASPDLTTDTVNIENRLIIRNNVANTWAGTFVTSASIGQGVYCEDTCEIRQYSPDGDAVSGDTYRVQVDILPILNPCQPRWK